MKTLDHIINTVTANGMRPITEERCKQIAEEWAELSRQEERERHKKIVSLCIQMSAQLRFDNPESHFAKRLGKALQRAGYGIKKEE